MTTDSFVSYQVKLHPKSQETFVIMELTRTAAKCQT